MSLPTQTSLDQQPPVMHNNPSLTQPTLRPVNFQPVGDGTQKGSVAMKSRSKLGLVLLLVAVVAGIGTGTGLYKLSAKSGNLPSLGGGQAPKSQVASGTINEGDVFGSPDESTFKDRAEGYLEIGGLDGEGSHKLLRAGGISQTVYLTSSVTDLDKFQGMEVKVWGETFKAQKAGWLMDVGRVQIVKVNGELPEGHTATTGGSEGGDE